MRTSPSRRRAPTACDAAAVLAWFSTRLPEASSPVGDRIPDNGITAKRIEVRIEIAPVKARTRTSTAMSRAVGRVAVTPAAPQPRAPEREGLRWRRRRSTGSRFRRAGVGSSRPRLEPSATRTASSLRRAAALLSTRFATLAHVTSRTSPTAPSRSNSGRWSGPDVSSRSGRATKAIEEFWFRGCG